MNNKIVLHEKRFLLLFQHVDGQMKYYEQSFLLFRRVMFKTVQLNDLFGLRLQCTRWLLRVVQVSGQFMDAIAGRIGTLNGQVVAVQVALVPTEQFGDFVAVTSVDGADHLHLPGTGCNNGEKKAQKLIIP